MINPKLREEALKDLGVLIEAAKGLQMHVAEHGVWAHWEKHQMRRFQKAVAVISDLFYTGTYNPDPKDQGRLLGAETCPASLFFEAVFAPARMEAQPTYGKCLDLGMRAGFTEEQTKGFIASACVLGIINIDPPEGKK